MEHRDDVAAHDAEPLGEPLRGAVRLAARHVHPAGQQLLGDVRAVEARRERADRHRRDHRARARATASASRAERAHAPRFPPRARARLREHVRGHRVERRHRAPHEPGRERAHQARADQPEAAPRHSALVAALLHALEDRVDHDPRRMLAAAVRSRLVELAPDLGLDRARVHDRHVHAGAVQVVPEPVAPGVQRRLRRGVDRLARRRDQRRERRHVHDRAAALREHRRDRRERGPHRGQEVHAHHASRPRRARGRRSACAWASRRCSRARRSGRGARASRRRCCSANGRSPRSPAMNDARAYARLHALTSSRSRSSRRATPTTRAPRCANASAVSYPIPDDAPVTSATAFGQSTAAARLTGPPAARARASRSLDPVAEQLLGVRGARHRDGALEMGARARGVAVARPEHGEPVLVAHRPGASFSARSKCSSAASRSWTGHGATR